MNMDNELTPENIISLKYKKLENNDALDNLGWGAYRDVLYSFLGVFTIGCYIFERAKGNQENYQIGEDNIIRVAGTSQRLYSRNYIRSHFEEFAGLADIDEIKEFASVYHSAGNIIPIWPGGNEFKGKARCYDIPDIFFYEEQNRKMEKAYLRYVLHKEIENVALTRFMTGSPYVKKVEDIFQYDIENYKKFVVHIVEEINRRAEEIAGMS